jgi:hypothetical protein
MGISAKERRAIHVDESTWRKARVMAAAFGIPIYAVVTQAIIEMAENHKEQVLIMLKEVKDEQVSDKRASRGRRPRG